MPGDLERLGPYQITGKIGQGGMGVVYQAQDTRLNRSVALKLIRDSGDEANLRKRFLREAQSAASVNHPNICRIYDIGENEGQPFLVMELLEGESLAERFSRGPLPLPEAVQITLGILSALAALHRSSILHRDLKPSNVFLSTQGVKLLDFGLAKPFAAADDPDGPTQTEITQPGMIAATPRYASPEQVLGKPLDSRSDLFSAGAILFEMLTGKYAFPGDSPIQIFHAILYDSIPTLGGSPAGSSVDRILHKALAKDPENRYRTADELAADVRAVLRLDDSSVQVETRTVKRLIVLPFRSLRADPDTDFLAFSLPDAIAASLAGLSSLVVRSSLVAARFAGPAVDLKEIAREADVDVVLTGTLLRAGTQLRLATQLIEAPAGTLIWSRTSQVELRDIFQLQDSLVSSVVESLALPLTAGERRQLARDAPADASAYDLYLRANELTRDRQSISAAIELYSKCVAKDPAYAPAWARLGSAQWLADKYAAGSAEKLAEADSSLRRALELNPDLALAHNLYTRVQVEQGRALDAMRRLLQRSQTAGNDPELFAGLTHACRYCGLLEASLAAHRQARRLDPRIPTTVVQTYFFLGDYQSALDASTSDFGYAIAASLVMLGRSGEAIAVLKEKDQPTSWRLGKLFVESLRSLLEGDRAASVRACDELLSATFRDPEGWYHLARQLGYLSEAERALFALSRAVDWGFFCFPAIAADPWLDSLRGQPKFKEILHTAHTRHEEARGVFADSNGAGMLCCAV
ncbi:MAG TPA: protein kinase [Bryobacteraceae bacterium]|nr:protein kinase [Bryobacteraceae bacterium]